MYKTKNCIRYVHKPFTVCVCTLILFVFTTSISTHVLAEEDFSDAITIVEKFHGIILENMQNAETLGYDGRYNALSPAIQTSFDTPLIAKVIIGRYWKGLEQQQQSEFIEIFNRLTTATYASRFDSYSEESFKTMNVEKLKKGRILVKTQLITSDSDPVKFDYMMHMNDGNWNIISIIANGINDISLKRAEYANVIKDKGFNGLVSDIEDKIKMYENGEI